MDRFRLSHILLCGLISLVLVTSFAATQDRDAEAQVLPSAYRKWLDEDARYLTSDEERAEFRGLKTDQQRDKFIEDFWERRNPNPGSTENKFKEEHYRRITYTNEHFAANVPGWKTDRGRTYIRYGAPDEIEQHFSAAGSKKASDLFGVGAIPYDWELWHYRYIEGIGKHVALEFVDTCGCGRYEIPTPNEALNKYKPR
jgi:GWxTD domain-containing protein